MAENDIVRVRLLDGVAALAYSPEVWSCYDAVFGDADDIETWRTDLFERHAGRDGYRLALAVEEGDVVGFAWGYVGRRGQFWPDLVADALPADTANAWLGDHFELVELAVLASHRGRGLGTRLHDRVLDGVERRCLLSTADDPQDPAARLYRRRGWQRLGALLPGVQVMGRQARLA